MSNIDSSASAAPSDLADPIAAQLVLHQAWLDSSGKSGARLALHHVNLTGYDFSHRDLRGSTFDQCTLDFCDFRFAKIGQVPFFQVSVFTGNVMKSANFGSATFAQGYMQDGSMSQTNFTYATFTESQFANIDSAGADPGNDFGHATFTNSTFTNLRFGPNSLKQVVLDRTWFLSCAMDQVDFTAITAQSSLLFRNCSLVGSHFKGLLVAGSQVIDCRLDSSVLERMLFNDDSSFTGSSFDHARILGCSLANCQLGKSHVGADLTGSSLSTCDARLSDFTNAILTGCDLHQASFQGANLRGVTWDATTNRNLTNFTGCTWLNGNTCGADSYGICHEQTP